MVINYICTLGIFILFSVFTVSKSAQLQCMDEDNKPVDWFILYKLPKLEAASDDDDRGQKYLYMSSKTMRSRGWQTPKTLITDSNSMPGNTLSPLYRIGKSKEEIWVLYNDQAPPQSNVKSTCGHTKGVVAANKEGGFWMVHSVPRFPGTSAQQQYIYPESGLVNGQTFLCMTLGPSEIEKAATQIKVNEAGVYYRYVSQSLDSIYPILNSIGGDEDTKSNKRLTKAEKAQIPVKSQMVLTTVGKNRFTSFAKSKGFQKDIYEDFVAPTLKANLTVETWQNGPKALTSECSKEYSVLNIKSVNLCAKTICDRFKSTKDHSKWAISSSRENPWVCIGDINRAEPQEKRGGGTVCLKSPMVWDSFFKSISVVEDCPKPEAASNEAVAPSVVMV